MADWPTIASLATAGGTLVLAVATFGSVRSANRAAQVAERALSVGLRPLLLASRHQDPAEKVVWVDEHITRVDGGHAVIEEVDGVIYMAALLRNAGSGIGVLHGWRVEPGMPNPANPPPPVDGFRRLTRDLYLPAGDTGYWQGAIREPDDPFRVPVAEALARRGRLIVDVLYGDHEGGQRVITRLGLTPVGDDAWLCQTSRHWNVDRDDPR
jgi:hypothetical protein